MIPLSHENWRESTAIDRDCVETLEKVGNNEIRV